MSETKSVFKPFYIDLATARAGRRYKGIGRYIRVADASSAAAVLSISIKGGYADTFETLKKNGRVQQGESFEDFFVNNDAQPGEWVRLIVTDGEREYDVYNPSQGTIDSIANPVPIDDSTPIKVSDVAAQTAIADLETAVAAVETAVAGADASIVAAIEGKGVVLTGATYTATTNATVELKSAAANTGGGKIKRAFIDGTVGNGYLTVGGNRVLSATISGVHASEIEEMEFPAGVAISQTSSGGSITVYSWIKYN